MKAQIIASALLLAGLSAQAGTISCQSGDVNAGQQISQVFDIEINGADVSMKLTNTDGGKVTESKETAKLVATSDDRMAGFILEVFSQYNSDFVTSSRQYAIGNTNGALQGILFTGTVNGSQAIKFSNGLSTFACVEK